MHYRCNIIFSCHVECNLAMLLTHLNHPSFLMAIKPVHPFTLEYTANVVKYVLDKTAQIMAVHKNGCRIPLVSYN